MSGEPMTTSSCSSSSDVVIVSAVRSSIGRMSGQFAGLPGHHLGGQVIRALLDAAVCGAGSSDSRDHVRKSLLESLEEVIMGQVFTAATGQNPARQAAVLAGLPYSLPAWSLNMLCGSGLQAVCLAADRLRANCSTTSGCIIVGGQESMSQAPHATPSGASLRRGGAMNTAGLPQFGDFHLLDTLMSDGLLDAFSGKHMGVTAENIAKKYNISRQEQDKFALSSQEKYATALRMGYVSQEIVPIEVPSKDKPTGSTTIMVTEDEFPRPQTTLESLARLKPAFHDPVEEGTVTAGNSSGVNDGAAALLLCRADRLHAIGLSSVLARIVGWHQIGCDPAYMGLGPVEAVRGLLKKVNWSPASVHLYEINEAFAAQTIAVARELEIPMDRLNVTGGAIALGHPLGCSGARILVTLVHALRRMNQTSDGIQPFRGVAALCIGGGMGIALAVETMTQ